MPTNKSATSYRLSAEARAVVDRWAREWGVSAAAIVDVALRQFGRWLEAAPPPGELLADLRGSMSDLADSGTPAVPEKKRPGRPRKDQGHAAQAPAPAAPVDGGAVEAAGRGEGKARKGGKS